MLYEFYEIAPKGVVAVPYILNLTELDDSEFSRVRGSYAKAVSHLDWEGVDLICVCGTPPFIGAGVDAYRSLVDDLRSLTDVTLVTGPQVEIEAMRASGMKTPTVITPHLKMLNSRFTEFVEAHGIVPSDIHGFDIHTAFEISLIHDRDLYRRTLSLLQDAPVGDGLHYTCPRWATVEILPLLEEVLGVPVTSSSQSLIWNSLARLHLIPPRASERWGSLFSRSAPSGDLLTAEQLVTEHSDSI